jgi:hypothetical protein
MNPINEETEYYVQANRKLDKRRIFIKSTIGVGLWVEICDALVDSEFLLKKINELDFLKAVERSEWVYYVNDDNYIRFRDFITQNYIKTKHHLK